MQDDGEQRVENRVPTGPEQHLECSLTDQQECRARRKPTRTSADLPPEPRGHGRQPGTSHQSLASLRQHSSREEMNT